MDAATERYRGLAGQHYHEGKRALPPTAYPWVARARARKLNRFVGLEDVVLEYGVGAGWNLAALPCQRRIGFDIADAVEATVRQHGIEFCSDLSSLDDALADVVLCHHMLEHTLHPPRVLAEIHRLLKPTTGRLVLVVPWEQERRHRRFVRQEPNHHLYTWSVQSLANLVEDCQFEVLQARTHSYGYDRFAAVWACRLRLGERGFQVLRRALQLARPLREALVVARQASDVPAP